MRNWATWVGVIIGSLLVAKAPGLEGISPFWPVFVAFAIILLTRQAAAGLGAGVIAGCLVLSHGSPIEALRIALEDHVFPQLNGLMVSSIAAFAMLLPSGSNCVLPGKSMSGY